MDNEPRSLRIRRRTHRASALLLLVLSAFLGGCLGSKSAEPMLVDMKSTPRPNPDFAQEGPCPPRSDFQFDSASEFIPCEILPSLVQYAPPVYPQSAIDKGQEGVVWITVCVGKLGSVLDAVVLRSSGITELDDAAREAAYWCKFEPAILNGEPVCQWISYKIEFVLKKR
jgi:TonB family protein